MANTSNDLTISSMLAEPSKAPPRRPARRHTVFWVAGALFVASNVAGILYFNDLYSAQPTGHDQPVAATKPPNDRLLEALGCQSSVHLYQTYLNIGLIADAVENEACTATEGSNMLKTVAGLMDVVDKQLEAVNMMDIREEDKEGVQRIRAISSLMRVQLASLQAYWLSGENQHVVRYHQTREQAWSELKQVLGI
jgi:hypothetical protein